MYSLQVIFTIKAAFHDTDTDILADILVRNVARMSVSVTAVLLFLFATLADTCSSSERHHPWRY